MARGGRRTLQLDIILHLSHAIARHGATTDFDKIVHLTLFDRIYLSPNNFSFFTLNQTSRPDSRKIL